MDLGRRDQQATAAIRSRDETGRHTTTRRELIALPDGAPLVDTPGMRELALWHAGDDGDTGDDVIERLAEECRFGNCRHVDEPDCAVVAAVRRGDLSEAHLASHHKLERERAHQAARQDAHLSREHGRRFARLVRAHRDAQRWRGE